MVAAPLVFVAAVMGIALYLIPALVRRAVTAPGNTAFRLASGRVVSIDLDETLPPRQISALIAKLSQADARGDRPGLQMAAAESHAASQRARQLDMQG